MISISFTSIKTATPHLSLPFSSYQVSLQGLVCVPVTDVGSFQLPHGSSHWALTVVMQVLEDCSTVPATDYLFLISWVFSLSSDQKDEGLWPNGSFHCLDSSSSEAQGPALEKKRKETKDTEASSFEVKQEEKAIPFVQKWTLCTEILPSSHRAVRSGFGQNWRGRHPPKTSQVQAPRDWLRTLGTPVIHWLGSSEIEHIFLSDFWWC